jgi:hypothetical protein
VPDPSTQRVRSSIRTSDEGVMTATTAAQKLDNQTADRFFQAGTALNRVLTEAPHLPRCSDDEDGHPRPAARIRHSLPTNMQVNRPGFREAG